MMNAGIVEGDKVIVDRSINAKSKDIVVAVVNAEYTIKRLYKTASKVELRSENPNYQPIVFKEGSELEIWVVVVGVVRHYFVCWTQSRSFMPLDAHVLPKKTGSSLALIGRWRTTT